MLENRKKSHEFAFLIYRVDKARGGKGINTISKNELITEYLKNNKSRVHP